MNNNFKQPQFEKDITKISEKIGERKEAGKIEKIGESHVAEALKPYINKPAVPAPGAFSPKKGTVLSESETLPDYMSAESAEVKSKVEALIGLAFSEGIEKSAKEASKQGPFILDAFHDALTSKLYQELKKRGLIK